MLFIDTQESRAALSFTTLIPALRLAFANNATVVPARHIHNIKSHASQGQSLIMPAWNNSGYYGVKVVNVFPDNGTLGLPGVHAAYTLYNAYTGIPLAHMDGDVITLHRTAAAAALGASYLARQNARVLTIVGAGRIARWIAPAMQAVRPIEVVQIWNRTRPGGKTTQTSQAEELAATLRQQGFQAKVVTDLADAVKASDIVSCATFSTQPLIQAEWLRPGTHLDLIGSFTPDMIEAHPQCLHNAAVYIDIDEALHKAGDLLQAFKVGALSPKDIRGRLQGLTQGTTVGRTHKKQITIFKAVGSALEDLAAAVLIYEASRDRLALDGTSGVELGASN